MLRDHIDALLGDLKERERQVIELRFGLRDGHPRTLEEVGKEFNVTRERIRQIEAKALRKLRNPVRESVISLLNQKNKTAFWAALFFYIILQFPS